VRQYLLRRALFALGTLIGVSLIIFVVLRILPGDPLVAILGMEGYAKLSAVDRAYMMKDLGFSDSLPVQYVRWL
jgi:peptide/nickel transport system permease protein